MAGEESKVGHDCNDLTQAKPSGEKRPPRAGVFYGGLERAGELGTTHLVGYVPVLDVVLTSMGIAREARRKGGHPKFQIFIRNNDLAEQIEHKKTPVQTGEKKHYTDLYRRLRSKL